MTDRTLQNFVNGKYSDTAEGRTSDVVDPSTGEVYLQAPISGRQDVDAAMQAAATAFETWKETTPAERSLALLRFADAMEKLADNFALVQTMGKKARLRAAEVDWSHFCEKLDACVEQLAGVSKASGDRLRASVEVA